MARASILAITSWLMSSTAASSSSAPSTSPRSSPIPSISQDLPKDETPSFALHGTGDDDEEKDDNEKDYIDPNDKGLRTNVSYQSVW